MPWSMDHQTAHRRTDLSNAGGRGHDCAVRKIGCHPSLLWNVWGLGNFHTLFQKKFDLLTHCSPNPKVGTHGNKRKMVAPCLRQKFIYSLKFLFMKRIYFLNPIFCIKIIFPMPCHAMPCHAMPYLELSGYLKKLKNKLGWVGLFGNHVSKLKIS